MKVMKLDTNRIVHEHKGKGSTRNDVNQVEAIKPSQVGLEK